MLINPYNKVSHTELMDKNLIRKIDLFLGYSGIEASLKQEQEIFVTFRVRDMNGIEGDVKWDLSEPIVIDGQVDQVEKDRLLNKVNSAEELIPSVERGWFQEICGCLRLEIQFR